MTQRAGYSDSGWAVSGVVGVTTLGLCLALWPRSPLGLWPGTLLAAIIGLGTALTHTPAALSVLRWPTKRGVLGGGLAGGAMAALTHAVYAPLATRWPPLMLEASNLYVRLDTPLGVHVAISIMALIVVAEELVWRGVAYGWLERRLGMGAAVIASTLIYALPQLASGSWLLPALAVGCGLVWTAQRAVSGSLTLPIVTHLTWDLLVMFAFPLVV